MLRPYQERDIDALPMVAGAWEVARWMTATFPHPYTASDARIWVKKAAAEDPTDNFAIELDGELVGGVGIRPQQGEAAGVAEFGYWLGRNFWGRGIATEASRVLANHAFGRRGLRRLEAHVFAPNAASARVLEKCGFVREAILRQGLTDREGAIVDGWLYAALASEWHAE